MLNRIGLIHADGLFSSLLVAPFKIAQYVKESESKIGPLLAVTPVLTPDESRKLGFKDTVEVCVCWFEIINRLDRSFLRLAYYQGLNSVLLTFVLFLGMHQGKH